MSPSPAPEQRWLDPKSNKRHRLSLLQLHCDLDFRSVVGRADGSVGGSKRIAHEDGEVIEDGRKWRSRTSFPLAARAREGERCGLRVASAALVVVRISYHSPA
jgi:hypothetical protein